MWVLSHPFGSLLYFELGCPSGLIFPPLLLIFLPGLTHSLKLFIKHHHNLISLIFCEYYIKLCLIVVHKLIAQGIIPCYCGTFYEIWSHWLKNKVLYCSSLVMFDLLACSTHKCLQVRILLNAHQSIHTFSQCSLDQTLAVLFSLGTKKTHLLWGLNSIQFALRWLTEHLRGPSLLLYNLHLWYWIHGWSTCMIQSLNTSFPTCLTTPLMERLWLRLQLQLRLWLCPTASRCPHWILVEMNSAANLGFKCRTSLLLWMKILM